MCVSHPADDEWRSFPDVWSIHDEAKQIAYIVPTLNAVLIDVTFKIKYVHESCSFQCYCCTCIPCRLQLKKAIEVLTSRT